jgi:hypothetical protein
MPPPRAVPPRAGNVIRFDSSEECFIRSRESKALKLGALLVAAGDL